MSRFFPLREIFADGEKRARLLFWIWILSMIVTVFGYVVIFYVLLKK